MISIIIPTYNRFDIVRETIQHAIQTNAAVEYEIIVVNDGASFPFALTHPKVSILKNPKKGVSSARNFGAALAKYKTLFFIDDDMWITNESLEAIQKMEADAFLQSNCSVLNWEFPALLTREMQQNKIGRYLLKANYHTLEGRLKKKIDYSADFIKLDAIGSGSFVIDKELFLSLGGYNEEYVFQGEDVDLSNKLNEAKIPVYLFTKITCFHNQRDRLQMDEFLDREYRGFYSHFMKDITLFKPNKLKQVIYTALAPLHKIILFLFNSIPNVPVFDMFTFRAIGFLSSVVYFKAWYAATDIKKGTTND